MSDEELDEAAGAILRLQGGRRMGWQEEAGEVVWGICDRMGLSTVATEKLGERLVVAAATVATWRRRYEQASGRGTLFQEEMAVIRTAQTVRVVEVVLEEEVGRALRAEHAEGCGGVVREASALRCECGAWRWEAGLQPPGL